MGEGSGSVDSLGRHIIQRCRSGRDSSGEVERHRQSVTESETESTGMVGEGRWPAGDGGSEQARREAGAAQPMAESCPEQGRQGRHQLGRDPRSARVEGRDVLGVQAGGLPDT